jgi:DNA (cytosine-5)-methyltransferase 1
VFIAATKTNKPGAKLGEEPGLPIIEKFEHAWNIQKWNLARDLPLDTKLGSEEKKLSTLSAAEIEWINAWNEFVILFKETHPGENLPGFPIWADEWVLLDKLKIPKGTPKWKENFLIKNAEFYTQNKKFIDKWLKKHSNLNSFPPSRRKLEWQAQDAKSLNETIMHFRPSGIRAKKATYVPALVAITQTSVLGKQKRRITFREGARLQGLPEWFDFLDQPQSQTFKQLGNGVNIGAVYNVMKALVLRDLDLLGSDSKMVKSILNAPDTPDLYLSKYHGKPSASKRNVSAKLQLAEAE